MKNILIIFALFYFSVNEINKSEVSAKEPKIVCYFSSWATYRSGEGKFDVEDIDSTLCTHINYAFAKINPRSFEVEPFDPYADLADNGGLNGYGRFVALKQKNANLKTYLAVGGYNQRSLTFSRMANNGSRRTTFIQSAKDLLLLYEFDGLDLDWEYPANNGGLPHDKENFIVLLQEMKKAFDPSGLEISSAIGMGYEVLQTAYDIQALTEIVNHVNLMTYDYHGSWENQTNHHTPLYGRPSDSENETYYNVESSVQYLIDQGAVPEKLILGIGAYGQTYNVPDCVGIIGETATGAGTAAPYTNQSGLYGYNEICSSIQEGQYEMSRDQYTVGPFGCLENIWVSNDDANSTRTKSLWAMEKGLGGGMIWSIDTDDFHDYCNQGRFPILGAINEVWRNVTPAPLTTLPPITSVPTEIKIACYFSSWYFYNTGTARFTVENIDGSLCTHIIYCSAKINNITLMMEPGDPNIDIANGMFEKLNNLKVDYPNLKTIISLGGANADTSQSFSNMVSSLENRQNFITSVMNFLKEYQFDGLDLMWEYPGDEYGKVEDKENFASLLTELRQQFETKSYVLSSVASVSESVVNKAYDMRAMAINLDFINLLTFDLHGSWEDVTGHHTSLFSTPDDSGSTTDVDIESSVQIWLDGGVPPNKLILGYASYGRSFSVEKNTGEIGEPSTGAGEPGPYSNNPGFLGYNEICQKLLSWTTSSNDYIAAPWSWGENQWVGYDNATSVGIKASWAKQTGLGGAMLYTLENDDYHDICTSGQYPLLKAINLAWYSSSSITTDPSKTIETTLAPDNSSRIICYFGSWAVYRSGIGQLNPEDIDPFLCTHIIYNIASINETTYNIVPADPWGDISMSGYANIVSLKNTNPKLKVMLSVGGTSVSSSTFSAMASTQENRNAFITSVIDYLGVYNFDGLDIIWEFPGDDKGSIDDKQNFVNLTDDMRTEFDKYRYILSAAVSMKKDVMEKAYNYAALSNNLDFINLMTFDFHDYRDNETQHQSQMYGKEEDKESYENYNLEDSVQYWLGGGAQSDKLILGIPSYAKTFSLPLGSTGELGSISNGAGPPGSFTNEAGFLSYYELCLKLSSWEVVYDDDVIAPFAFKLKQWAAYDDKTSIRKKVAWAKSLNLGGVMIWSLETDDIYNICGGGEFTLTTFMKSEWLKSSGSTVTPITSLQPTVTENPSISIINSCYYGSWTLYRSGIGLLEPKDIDPFLCTHIIYNIASIDETTYNIVSADPNTDITNSGYANIVSLKNTNPKLKVMLSVGGTSVSSSTFSAMASTQENRNAFITSVIDYLGVYNFDGLDIIWEFPGDDKGSIDDKQNFVNLTDDMRTEFDKYRYILSAAVSMKKDVMEKAYNYAALSNNLDFINLMTFDFHDYRDNETQHQSQMYGKEEDKESYENYNLEDSVQYWLGGGAQSDKLILGIPSYAKTFSLPLGSTGELGSISNGAGPPGSFTNEAGFLSYYELCLKLSSWEVVYDDDVIAPFAFKLKQWAAYDDKTSIRKKVAWAKSLNLGGVMIWSLETDDIYNICGGGEFTLTTFMKSEWLKSSGSTVTPITSLQPTVTENPSISIINSCYYGSWTLYRSGIGLLEPKDIDPFLCTHIIYNIASIDETTYNIVSADPNTDITNSGYANIVSLKNTNPKLKVMLSVGGTSVSSSTFSAMASTQENRNAFITSVIDYLGVYNFDGLDIIWEFPGDEGGSVDDKHNFVTLTKRMKREFEFHGLILSAAVSMKKDIMENAYDYANLSKNLDFINLMAFDFHDYRDGETEHHSQMFQRPNESPEYISYNVESSVDIWINEGADLNKLVLGIPMYAKTYSLPLNSTGTIGSPSENFGPAGQFTKENGTLAYYEICSDFEKKNWIISKDEYIVSPYIFHNEFWACYDDVESLTEKVNWARRKGLRGGMLWSLELDDIYNTCGNGKFSLTTAHKNAWESPLPSTVAVTTEQSTTYLTSSVGLIDITTDSQSSMEYSSSEKTSESSMRSESSILSSEQASPSQSSVETTTTVHASDSSILTSEQASPTQSSVETMTTVQVSDSSILTSEKASPTQSSVETTSTVQASDSSILTSEQASPTQSSVETTTTVQASDSSILTSVQASPTQSSVETTTTVQASDSSILTSEQASPSQSSVETTSTVQASDSSILTSEQASPSQSSVETTTKVQVSDSSISTSEQVELITSSSHKTTLSTTTSTTKSSTTTSKKTTTTTTTRGTASIIQETSTKIVVSLLMFCTMWSKVNF